VLLQGQVEWALHVKFAKWVGSESMTCKCRDIYFVSKLKELKLASHPLDPSKGCFVIINHFNESISSFFF
jgi:hypothetical protein